MASPTDFSSVANSNGPASLLFAKLPAPAVIGSAWLLSSAIFTTYTTNSFLDYSSPAFQADKKSLSRIHGTLSRMSRPTLLTLTRFLGSFLLGLLMHPDLQLLKRIKDTLSLVPALLVPSVFLFIANLTNSIALKRIGIPLTYTSKCGIVIITALLTFFIDGPQALPSNLALLSLLPIATGIALASSNSPNFDMLGFVAAATSATSQSALNISSKKIMNKLSISGPTTQRTMVLVGLSLTSLTVLTRKIRDGSKVTADEDQELELPPLWLTLSSVLAYHTEYLLSFSFVPLVAPITYGTVDAIRRLSIIVCGKIFFGGPKLTPTNLFGIIMALAGALFYSVFSNM